MILFGRAYGLGKYGRNTYDHWRSDEIWVPIPIDPPIEPWIPDPVVWPPLPERWVPIVEPTPWT